MVGAVGAGAGAGFFFLFAGVAFFIPFFLRTGAPRFAFLDFFAMFNLAIELTNYATRYHAVVAYRSLCTFDTTWRAYAA